MDKTGTVELTKHRPGEVPVNGFEWVRGYEAFSPEFRVDSDILVARPGPVRHVDFPDDLYASFASLPVEKEAVVRFACAYGGLHRQGMHFHRTGTREGLTGEPWFEWKLYLSRFQTTVELWYRLKDHDDRWVKRFVEQQQKPGALWVLHYPPFADWNKPLEFAHAMVLTTINRELGGGIIVDRTCAECSYTVRAHSAGDTFATVRRASNGSLELAIASDDLLRAMWLQMAAVVTGQRKLKKCEAPDCERYMDVTDSARPGARRMHNRCEERLRKQKYRERKVVK